MLRALHKLLLTLYIYGHVAGDDFRPTPIPLDEWRPDESRGRAGILETTKTAGPPATVVVPAHYWEDALRHSVYLTLVRDKIDQLIAKGEVIAPNSSPDLRNSNEVNDQDLWEKIKAAPFERLKEDEPTTYGDVTILARGRLLEEHGGYRFAEDDKSKEKCDNDKCMEGVKAFWSVKRVRQRDQEISPGRYHYELTFSVMSQIPKKQKKPYEHPIRTFTVQENDKGFEPTKAYNRPLPPTQASRPERAIWFHKNIQVPQHTKRPQSGLDRLFSSWFDDDDDEPIYNPPRRLKQISYHPSPSQYANFGYVGGANFEHYSQKALPYPYRPQLGRYQSHPLNTPPIAHIPHNFEPDLGGINNPYISQADYKASGINNIQRTTRPAVLPTPLPPLPTPSKEPYVKTTSVKNDIIDNVTSLPDIHSGHKQHKTKTNMKMSPFPEQLRPPIYNAPPGVFVTLDKKPFKPLPPLKAQNVKPLRSHKPIDFRPSPQVLDVQFSEPDPLFDTVFRPITVKYFDDDEASKNTPTSEDNEKGEESIRKPTVAVKRPMKKQGNTNKPNRITTTTTTVPDIITANNNPEQDDDMEWADVVGIFTKTTPMEAQKEKPKTPQTTTPLPTSSVTVTTTSKRTTTATSTAAPSTTVSTTVKPKKRTRPPPKFNKTEKIKKHKRITTTTTTTTTTDVPSTTKLAQEKKRKKLKQELTQQASNSVTATTKTKWEPSSKTSTTTPFSTIGTTTTAYPPTTVKITTTSKAIPDEPSSTTVRSKSANRFRQSTLMIKGTSVKHDRWTATTPLPEKAKGQSILSSFPYRRKGSNFNGYISSTAKTLDESRNLHGHIDGTTTERSTSPKNEETTVKSIEILSTVAPTSDETNETPIDVVEEFVIEDKNQETYEESRDHSEYIFPEPSDLNNNKNNEISSIETIPTTENIISTTTSRPLAKKKKCKKKHQNFTTKHESNNVHERKDPTTTIAPSTTPLTTPSLLEDLLNDFKFEDSKSETPSTTPKQDQDEEQSQDHEQYFEVNDDLEELLDSLKHDKYEEVPEEYDEEDDNNDNDDEEENEHPYEEEDKDFQSTNDSSQYSQKDYEDDDNRPFTLLELMAME